MGEDHLEVAATLTSWSRFTTELHDYPRAEAFLQKALEIRQAQLGNRHPDVAESLYRLGIMRYMQDKYEAAGEALRSALEVHRVTLGPNHITTLKNVLYIAKLHHALGDQELSEEHYKTAEKHFLHVLSGLEATHYGWRASVKFDMALLYRSWGDLKHSEALFLEAIEEHRREASRPAPDPYEALIERYLAKVLHAQGQTPIAEPRLRTSFETLRQAWGFSHIHTASTAVDLADLLISTGENTEAGKLLEDALVAYRSLSGVELWRTLRARALLAACLHGLEQPKRAHELTTAVRSQITPLRGKKRLEVESALQAAEDAASQHTAPHIQPTRP